MSWNSQNFKVVLVLNTKSLGKKSFSMISRLKIILSAVSYKINYIVFSEKQFKTYEK